MLRKVDIATSSLKTKLLKALATTNTPPSPSKNVDIRLYHFWSRQNNFDQGVARGGAIAEPYPQDRRSVGKAVQNSQHFLSKIVTLKGLVGYAGER